MTKLLVICLTALMFAAVRECSRTTRLGMELEDRHKARLFSEYVRQNPAPSIQIIPGSGWKKL
jgi:hypothetical protein